MTDDETTRLKGVAQQQELSFILRVIRIDLLPPLLPRMLMNPRTVCACQPVADMISASVACGPQ
jgi:hypothetical protein